MKFAQVKCHLKLTFCTFLVCFAQVLIGSSFIFTSALLVELRQPSSKIQLTVEDESWLVSIPVLVCPVGLLINGVLIDNVGKIITLQVNLVPMTLSWLLLLLADTYRTLFIAKILLGFCFGVYSCMVLYIIEICPTNLRPIYVSAATLCAGVGMLMETMFAAYLDWRTVTGVMCAMSVANLFALFAVPEPSMWLRARGRAQKADRVDEWLDLKHVQLQDTAVAADAAGTDAVTVARCTRNGQLQSPAADAANPPPAYWSQFLRPNVWKPTVIVLAFFLFQHGTGIYVMFMYSIDVLQMFRIPLDDVTLSLIMSVARVLGAVAFAMLHRLRRRSLVIVSSGVMTASLIVLIAVMRTFKDVREQPSTVTVTTLIATFAAFMFFALLGVMPIPWILCGEVFPMSVKGVMNGVVQGFGYIIWFAICKIYPLMILKYGADVVWSVFAIFCVLNVLFAIFIMPETNGKTVDEILSYFEPSKKTKNLNVS